MPLNVKKISPLIFGFVIWLLHPSYTFWQRVRLFIWHSDFWFQSFVDFCWKLVAACFPVQKYISRLFCYSAIFPLEIPKVFCIITITGAVIDIIIVVVVIIAFILAENVGLFLLLYFDLSYKDPLCVLSHNYHHDHQHFPGNQKNVG